MQLSPKERKGSLGTNIRFGRRLIWSDDSAGCLRRPTYLPCNVCRNLIIKTYSVAFWVGGAICTKLRLFWLVLDICDHGVVCEMFGL